MGATKNEGPPRRLVAARFSGSPADRRPHYLDAGLDTFVNQAVYNSLKCVSLGSGRALPPFTIASDTFFNLRIFAGCPGTANSVLSSANHERGKKDDPEI